MAGDILEGVLVVWAEVRVLLFELFGRAHSTSTAHQHPQLPRSFTST